MTEQASFGKRGEEQVARYLQKRGYLLVASNYHTPYGEIDLIMLQGDYLVFVEVKSRRKKDADRPARTAVDSKKQSRIRQSAMYYLAKQEGEGNHPQQYQPRFDVAEVYAEKQQGEGYGIHYYMNAFQ